jgi:hypothetical protein
MISRISAGDSAFSFSGRFSARRAMTPSTCSNSESKRGGVASAIMPA